MKTRLCLLDADYFVEKNRPVIRLWCKDSQGKSIAVFDRKFVPYFYIEPKEGIDLDKLEKRVLSIKFEGYSPESVERVKRKILGKERELLKVFIRVPADVPKFRGMVKDWKDVREEYEYGVNFYKRYVIDKGLVPMGWFEAELEGPDLKEAKPLELEEYPQLRVMAFDIETIEERGGEKIIMVSLADSSGFRKVISYGKRSKVRGVEIVKGEKELIGSFGEIVNKRDPDILVGYNCIPYDEDVILSNGNVMQIGEYIKNHSSEKPDVLAMVGSRIKPTKVEEVWKYNNPGSHEVLRIITKSGREIRVTPGNKLPIGTETGIEWMQACNVNVNDLIATPKTIEFEGSVPNFIDFVRNDRTITDQSIIKYWKEKLIENYKTFRKAALELGINYNTLKSSVGFRLKGFKSILDLLDKDWNTEKSTIKEIDGVALPYIDERLMYITGLIASDGSIDKNEKHNRVCFANTDKKLIEGFSRIIEEKFKVKVHENCIQLKNPKHKNRIHARVSCSVLKDFLNGIGIPPGKKEEDKIEFMRIFPLPKTLIGAFIAGLIDGDGYVHANKSPYGSTSFYIACKNEKSKKKMQKLLTRIGIITAVHSRGLYFIKCRDNLKMIEKFVLPWMNNKEKIANYLKKSGKTDLRGSLDVLPGFVGKELNNIRKIHGISSYKLKNTPHSTLYYYENGAVIHRDKVREILDDLRGMVSSKELANLEKDIESDIFWDRIKSIKKESVPAVFDLTTSNGNFIANNIIIHNSDRFDFVKLAEKAKEHKIELGLGRSGKHLVFERRGRVSAAAVSGRVHVDLYNFIDHILSSSLSTEVLTLDRVARELIGKGKAPLELKDIEKAWRKRDVGKIASYCQKDSVITLQLADYVLPQIFELCRVTGQTLFDTSRMYYSQLVEWLYIRKSNGFGEVSPNRPKFDEVQRRRKVSYLGGYVHTPREGIHEKIAVFDFASLYPTITITHNVSPETLDCSCCPGGKNNVPELKHHYCTKKTGFVTKVLEDIVLKRIEIKEKMKRIGRETTRYRFLNNRQYALKILANASYGYYAYPGSRWYSKVCAESITSLGRMYIKSVISMAERMKFWVIYGDTDSMFLRMMLKDVKPFLKKVNSSLPGVMELDFKGFYQSGIFVLGKGGVAAKKRYALIDKKGEMIIRGFERVRRDWSAIAKETQEKVLLAVLKDKSPEKAVRIVRRIVKNIGEGKIGHDDLIIYTQLTKPISEYEQIGPHVAVAKKIIERGGQVRSGATIEYIVTKGTGTISERSEPAEDAKGFDPEYYINNQVLPAAMRVLAGLGYREEDFLGGGKSEKEQLSLAKYMKK